MAKFVLFKARHTAPEIDGLPSIFGDSLADPTDVVGMNHIVAGVIDALPGHKALDVYVTGLTVATAAVIRMCYIRAIPLTLWHFDRESGQYYQQVIITEQDAAFQRELGWF